MNIIERQNKVRFYPTNDEEYTILVELMKFFTLRLSEDPDELYFELLREGKI